MKNISIEVLLDSGTLKVKGLISRELSANTYTQN
jgi:hypothetical protein